MIRNCNLEDISDGRMYEINDMVKCDTNGCRGCHKCCTTVDDTIILNPFDIACMKKATGKNFNELISLGYIELNMRDGLILPNIKMEAGRGCSFLDEDGRCTIHADRPDICRLYPLGRVYIDGDYKYILQRDECVMKNKTKIKVKKWIGSENTETERKFILGWHDITQSIREGVMKLKASGQSEKIDDIVKYILATFYLADVEDSYDVIVDIIKDAKKNLKIIGIEV